MSKVQIGIIVAIIVISLTAILVLSGALPGIRPLGGGTRTNLVIWGTMPESSLLKSLTELRRTNSLITVEYSQKSEEKFENEFLNALALGRGPDIVILPSNLILKTEDKLVSLLSVMTERDFRDSYADGTEILIIKNKIVGLPLLIDPLVLYWNRDLFRNDSLALTPKTWDEFLTSARTLTKIDAAGKIVRSGAALGVENNVSHPKEILSLLILQTGEPIVSRENISVTLGKNTSGISASENALRFYTEFANPSKVSYSWSPALPLDIDMFTRGDLAMYFGFASEYRKIIASNPHLNFDVAAVPQVLGSNTNVTYGNFIFAGITIQSKNAQRALETIRFIASPSELSTLSNEALLPPSTRNLLAGRIENPALQTFYREAVKMRSWLDADPAKTTEIFSSMIRSLYSGRKRANDAIRDAKNQLEILYPSI